MKNDTGKRRVRSINALVADIRSIILTARHAVVRTIDTLQVMTNFAIGRRIIVSEQKGKTRAAYGKALLKELSARLTKEFGRGYSHTNLKLMRQFYLMYRNQIGQTLSDQLPMKTKSQTLSDQCHGMHEEILASWRVALSWSHYVFLLGLSDAKERKFYEIEAMEQNWSLREMKRQFNTSLYERIALGRDKEGVKNLSRKGQIIEKPEDLLKEPYVLEFLGLDEQKKFSESDLESAIIDKIEQFLLELGKGFLFESRQKRFTFDEDHFFVDLVFYNRLLKCYVLIDLKIGKLTHQDLGQMQMYVNYYDRHVKTDKEHSTIGIILCRKNREAIVEMTLPQGANIHAKEYQLYLPSKAELKRKLIEWTTGADK